MKINPIYWDIENSPYESEIIKDTRTYASGKHSISVIDQFSGKRPYLIDARLSKKLNLRIVPTIILDSNVATDMHQYHTAPAKLGRSRVNSTIKLLRHLVRTNWDYNPFFYCIESASKATNHKDYLLGVTPTIHSIIELQLMMEEKFLRENTVQINREKESAFLKEKGAESLWEVAEKMAQYYWVENKKNAYVIQIRYGYAVLLKTALLRQSEKPPYKKIEQLHQFMRKELGCYMAREFHLACHYLANLLSRLIMVEKNIEFDKAKRNLWATAWDIFLLRIPEILLSKSTADDMVVGYVCTAEKELQILGQLFNIKKIYVDSGADADHVFMPKVRDVLGLPPERIFDDFISGLRNEALSTNPYRKPISEHRLYKLINRLEIELKDICKWSSEDIVYL